MIGSLTTAVGRNKKGEGRTISKPILLFIERVQVTRKKQEGGRKSNKQTYSIVHRKSTSNKCFTPSQPLRLYQGEERKKERRKRKEKKKSTFS